MSGTALQFVSQPRILLQTQSNKSAGGPRVGFGGHIFQPLTFNPDGSVADLDCSPAARFPVAFTPGTTGQRAGLATKAADQTPPSAVYFPVCDSDQWTLYQTWVSSKSGKLTSVAVNVAKSVQTIPLTINVFKYSTLADLVSPLYKYTLLGTGSFNSSSLSTLR